MGNEYSYVGAVVGATYPEMGKLSVRSCRKPSSWYRDMVHRAEKVPILFISLMKTDLVRSSTLPEESLQLQTGKICFLW